MKKQELTKLALMGLSSGLLMTSQLSGSLANMKSIDGLLAVNHESSSNKGTAKKSDDDYSDDLKDVNDGNMGYHLMTEDELLLELNPEGIATYKSLSPEGKELARKVASQRCNSTNPCKGFNACQTDKNECAGKGSCKMTGKCGFSDKNLAVKVVSEKMKGKREAAAKQ